MLSASSLPTTGKHILELLTQGCLSTENPIHPSSSNNSGTQASCTRAGNPWQRQAPNLGFVSTCQLESTDNAIPLPKLISIDGVSDTPKQFVSTTVLAPIVAAPPLGPYLMDVKSAEDCLPRDKSQLFNVFLHNNSVFRHEVLAHRAHYDAELYEVERSYHRTQFQRENHILAERQRREEMNDKFSVLRSIVPNCSKKDKASIVGETVKYITDLETTLKQLQSSKESLKRQHSRLARPKNLSPTNCGQGKKLFSPIRSTGSIKQTENSALSSPDQITERFVDATNPTTEVEVQRLGGQAVIKVLCRRSRGLLLRIFCALDQCKVAVLQSNVTTVENITVLFITVEMATGVSASTEELTSALHSAAIGQASLFSSSSPN